MTRFSIENIAKDLYKRVNADKTDKKYYECVNSSDKLHFYQSIGYAEICIAKFAKKTDKKLYLTTEICIEEGRQMKYLRAIDGEGCILEEITLPNGRITHKQLMEYVAQIYSEIKNRTGYY